jgi:hypothetical protein
MSDGTVSWLGGQPEMLSALCEVLSDRKMAIYEQIALCATNHGAVSALTEEVAVLERLEKGAISIRTMVISLQQCDLPSVRRLIFTFTMYMRAENEETRGFLWRNVVSALESVKTEAEMLGCAMLEVQRAKANLLRAQAERERELARLERARAEQIRMQAEQNAARIYQQAKRDTESFCDVA